LWPKPYFKALKETNNVYVTINNVNVDLSDVKINSDWNFNKNVFDGDVALVTLFNPVTISNEIQPICLPPFSGPLVQPGGVVVRNGGLKKLI
jgi:glutathione peroxidase-family protein